MRTIFKLALFSVVFFGLGAQYSFARENRVSMENSFGVFLSPTGQQFVNDNLLDILFLTGYSAENFYLGEVEHELEETELEELLSEDAQMRELAIRAKESLERFLMGFELERHRFNFNGEELLLNLFWDNFQINFTRPHFSEPDNDNGGILATIELEATELNFYLDKFRVRDNNNEFLGEWGFDGLELVLKRESAPLQITIPVMIYNTEPGQFRFSVRPAYSNLDLLQLEFDFESPITMPRMGISINDYHMELNRDEVEISLRDAMPNLLVTAQEMVQDFFQDQFHETLSEFLNDNFQVGGIDMNAMEPPGAPEGSFVEKFNWGVELSHFDFIQDHIVVTLGSFANDPMAPTTINLPRRYQANGLPARPFESFGYDLAFGVNKGFVNRLVQLSYNRGYFKTVEVEGEDDIILSSQPILNVSGSGANAKARLSLEIEQHVGGINAIFVRNPMRIQFDLIVSFPVRNGKIQMVIDGVDQNSIHVDDRYIRMFAGTVRNAVEKQIREVDLRGLVLVEEFPIPDTIGGVQITPSATKIDENGYLMVYMDFDLL